MSEQRLRARLDALDRRQLAALVRRLVDARPELADLVYLPLPGEAQPLETGPLTSRVTTILRTMGHDWRASYRARSELFPVLSIPEERLDAGAVDDGRRAYRAIIDAILACYVHIRDEESEIAGVVCECAAGLGRALDATAVPAERRAILRDIFDVFVWDRVQHGGYGTSEPVERLLVDKSTADEKAVVLDWILAVLPPGDAQRARWGRQAAGELYLAILGEDADPGPVLRWSGLTRRYIRHLLTAGRHAEAVAALAGASDDLGASADLLVSAGLRDEAVRVMASHPRLLDEEGQWIPRWLEKHGHDASAIEALARNVDRFRRRPTIGEWDRIRAEAEAMGLWAEAAPRLLAVIDDARVAVQPVRARALAAVGRFEEAVAVHATLNESSKATCGVAIARDAAGRRPDLARGLLQAAIQRLARRKGRAAREERERLEGELAGLSVD